MSFVIELDSNDSRKSAITRKIKLRRTPGYEQVSVRSYLTQEQHIYRQDLKAIINARNAKLKYELVHENGRALRYGLDNGKRYYWGISDLQLVKKYMREKR